MSRREALANDWRNLSFRFRQATPAGRRLRFGLFLLLFALVGLEAGVLRELWRLKAEEPRVLRGNPAAEEMKAFQERLPQQRAFLEHRGRSLQTAQLAEAVGRRPYDGGVTVPLPAPEIPPEPAWANQPPPPPPEPLPPMITLKAVMVLGNKAAAVADIEGEAPARILRVGTEFGSGQGRVVRITPEGVRIKWRSRIEDIGLQPY